jgi:hypothetical protein
MLFIGAVKNAVNTPIEITLGLNVVNKDNNHNNSDDRLTTTHQGTNL